MKRYAGKSSRATKNASAKKSRDPAWYGSPEEHSRAAKRGVRKKKVAKAVASVKSKQGWLTRYQEESAKLRVKKRPTKKDVERLKELRRKIRDQKASLLRKPAAKKLRVPRGKLAPKKSTAPKKPTAPKKLPKKPTARQQAAIAKAREEAKQQRARTRRRALAEERRIAAEQERRARLRSERARSKAKKEREAREEARLQKLAAIKAERKARELAQRKELEELRQFRRTELERRRQATLEAAALLDNLKKVYGSRVPSHGEMIGISHQVDLTVREIYAIWHGSPEVFAA